MAITLTVLDSWYDSKRQHAAGTLTVGAGTYTANGITIPWATGAPDTLKITGNPSMVRIQGLGGYNYLWDTTNLTLRIFQGNAPTGTVTIGSGTISGGQGASGGLVGLTSLGTTGLLVASSSLVTAAVVLSSSNAVNSNILTMSATALAELATSSTIPSAVTGDTIQFYAVFKLA